VIVLDHGPVFRLAQLQGFGPDFTQSPIYLSWWNDMLDRWATTLHLIIWLDADDTVLLDRINSRNVNHTVKGYSEQEAQRFLARYRSSYEQIIAKMTAGRGPQILRIDSHQESVDAIADRVLQTLRLNDINDRRVK
jgi:deoxyadenosine/deoxycytidine kinase